MPDATNIYEQTPDDDTTGGRLARAREARNLSVKELAWKTGVQMATVKAWESDRSSPSSHRLSLLAGLLDVSLSWILHGVGIGPNESEIEDEDLSVDAKFDRLKALHAQTSVLIKLLEGDLRNNNLRGSDSRSAFG